jgi:hypothetical protein
MRKRLLASLLLVFSGVLLAAGCNDWERNTFNTLASSKAVIDGAQQDYEAKTIPQNGCSYKLINDAKAAQTAAVDGMVVYEQLKSQKGNTQAQEATVTGELAALVPLVAQVQSLIANPAAACGGK